MKELDKKLELAEEAKISPILIIHILVFLFYLIYTKSIFHAIMVCAIFFWFIGIPLIYIKSDKLPFRQAVSIIIAWVIIQIGILILFGGDICSVPFSNLLYYCH